MVKKDLVQEYITTLENEYKNSMMELVLMKANNALLVREIENLTQKLQQECPPETDEQPHNQDL